jgi:ABC-type lipoprotein export system ATPase subunit
MNERSQRGLNSLAIETRDLTKVYASQSIPAVRGLNLRVHEGEFVAIMGASGSGKSALLYLIAGLAEPTGGEVLIGGTPVSGLKDAERARLRNAKMGFVFQRFNLLGFLSVRDNVEVPRRLGSARRRRWRRAEDLLEAVGLAKKERQRVSELSAGEQQRVAIARALINDPDILLADEPTGNLDSRNAAAILDLLLRLKREFGHTILLVTHNPGVAMKADRILEMQDGMTLRELVPEETPDRPEWVRGLTSSRPE